MRRLFSLRGLAIATWVSCLAFLGVLAIMLARFAWHPHFLPLTAMLVLVIVTGLGLILGGAWRVVRGPTRREALSWLLLGMVPLWSLTGFFLYGLAVGTGRVIPLNLPLKLMGPLGESVMDLEARFRYPQRTAGEKVVMISETMGEADARALVSAMDRHVRALEARLGRATTGTVHWVRGPMMGMRGKALFGLCMGTRPGDEPSDSEGLSATDRHEVAHCVLTSHCSARFDPPSVLTEGWAEANQGTDPAELAARDWERVTQGNDLTLRQLTGPDWYDRHEWPAYVQGATLVNFLLARFGPERFLELYTTCTRSTFEADCRRILGLDLDGLDAAYRADVERHTGHEGSLPGRLRRLSTGPKVARPAWQAFLDEYLPEAERLVNLAPDIRSSAEYHYSRTDQGGKTTEFVEQLESNRSGEFRSLRTHSKNGDSVYLAHPRHSFQAHRKTASDAWEIRESPGTSLERSYRRILGAIDERDPWIRIRMATGLLTVVEELRNHVDTSAITVVELARITEGGRRFIRVRLEDHSPIRAAWRSFTLILAADDHFAVRSDEIELSTAMTLSGEFDYDRHQGLPILRSIRNSGIAADGTHTTSGYTVLARRFEPTPEAEFTQQRLLGGDPVRTIAEPDPYAEEPSALLRWYWLPFVAGALCLILGAVSLLGARPGRGV